ncbi:NADPH:quinone reductase-like Zn-dependent oxidoreductase [Prauserella shujinwangii]|uniref:NADPH:quinone reductase-like Zn-dependent oxidoreductase n=1 Tax=Prauserella shujinwangii TaxID=1453103 RepID=A0A2T0LSM4_9PSEU|nr:NADP-dependent oxidoreductase [Prauserella shujinwangii]PRX46658.1 NADPH:quinone reductase-like Zn-dependent oxidoreductase [Prauserella shujinwangii]
MKAMRYHRYGGSDVLDHEEAERPVPGPGQVLVRVAGTSFNPVDIGLRAGALREVFPLSFPHVPGVDLAGTVAELGADVEGWRAGDAVVAFLPMNADGAAAEYVLAPAEVLAPAPRTVELADAAVLPVGGLTAWQALFEHAGLERGQTILVNGAGGAVGGYAVQLAKQAGAVVTATASARSADRLRGYGADRLVGHLDHTTTPVTAEGQPFDVVLNLVATTPEETAALVDLVRDDGALVSTTTPPPAEPGRGIRTARVFARSEADQLAGLAARVDAGQLRIDVAARRPLGDLPAVHDEAAAGRLAGKTVLLP